MHGPVVHSCPHCAQPFTLEPAYLAQYGGQTTMCSRCNKPFTLPLLQSGPSILGYATPPNAHQQQGLWREGKLLVACDQANLPQACVKCGQPSSGAPYRRTYYWHHPGLYFLILFPGLLIYLIVAICVRKKGTVHLWLCEQHRSARARNMLLSWIVFLSSIAFWVMAGNTRNGDTQTLLILCGFLAFIVGLIAIMFSSRLLYPKRIDRGYLWLGGAGEGFLRRL